MWNSSEKKKYPEKREQWLTHTWAFFAAITHWVFHITSFIQLRSHFCLLHASIQNKQTNKKPKPNIKSNPLLISHFQLFLIRKNAKTRNSFFIILYYVIVIVIESFRSCQIRGINISIFTSQLLYYTCSKTLQYISYHGRPLFNVQILIVKTEKWKSPTKTCRYSRAAVLHNIVSTSCGL